MPEALILVLMAAVGAVVILVLGLTAFRFAGERATRVPPMPAAYLDAAVGTWRRGTLRVVDDRLALRGPGGLAAGPWIRGDLDLAVAKPVTPEGAQALGREDLVQVPVTYGTSNFELALDEQHYTALRAWVEAAPPGWNTQIA